MARNALTPDIGYAKIRPGGKDTPPMLIISIPLKRPWRSEKGKVNMVASSYGHRVTNLVEEETGLPITITAGAYLDPKALKARAIEHWQKIRRLDHAD